MIRLLLSCLFFSGLFGQRIFEEFEKDRNNKYHYKETYRFDSVTDDGSYTLSIENVEGDIIVTGHQGSGVEMTITHKIRAITEKRAKRMVEQNKIAVYQNEDKHLIQIKSDEKLRYRQDVSTEFKLNLPINIHLNLETTGGDINVQYNQGESILKTSGGDIELKNLSGRIEAKTSGGDIESTNLEGLIRVHTSGGDIEIKHSDGQFNASTSGGDMEFLHLTGNVEAHTSGGSITLENIEGESISAKTAGGDINVEDVTANIEGKTSGGEINLENVNGNVNVSTSGGDIEIDELAGSLICYTSGGEIEGDDIIGTVDASTSAGDIELRLSYETDIKDYGVSLKTNAGDIMIQIPSGLPVNVDAEIYGSNSSQDLNSDIPLDVKTKDNRVIGSGSVKGGTIPMKLMASFGNITIELE